MRKCPYCAELIQDDAKFCRYCKKRVRGKWLGVMVKLVIAAFFITFVVIHIDDLKNVKQGYRKFVAESKEIWQSLKDGAKYVRRIEKDKQEGNLFQKFLKLYDDKDKDKDSDIEK